MAQVISNYGIPRIKSYEDALRVWTENDKLDGKRNKFRDDVRLLDKRKNNTLKIVRYGDDAIGCRYYDTDVVIYYPDGHIRVIGYASISTNQVMEKVLPDGMSPIMLSRLGTLIACRRGKEEAGWCSYRPWKEGEVYDADGGYRRNDAGEWEHENPYPIRTYSCNRKAINAFRKTLPLEDFFMWADMYLAHKGRIVTYYTGTQASHVLACLQDRERWPELVHMTFGCKSGRSRYSKGVPYTLREGIEMAVMACSGAVERHDVPSIKLSELDKVTRNFRKYQFMI